MEIQRYDPNRHNLMAVRDLLSMAVGFPNPEKLSNLLDRFYTTPDHAIFISVENGKITGMIGLDITALPHALITHLAVQPELRKQGMGRRLIAHVTDVLHLQSIGLETDQDAVGFYRACGFEVEEIESKWPGVRRFRCNMKIGAS